MKPEKFLTAEQQNAVVEAVRLAEKGTSGEIRIHIDSVCEGDPVKRAEHLFFDLGMNRTELHNGVLIYIAYESKVVAVIGDKGINDLVPSDFWKDVVDAMVAHFHAGHFVEGLAEAVAMTGEKLRCFFPYQDDDVNELPDEISFEGDE